MSKLKTYLDLVRRGIPNIDKIAEGLINQVKLEYNFLPEDEQEEITRRRLICQSCPLFSLNAKLDDSEYKKLFNEEFVYDDTRGEYCGSCGCPIATKTASLGSDCGLDYYNKTHPENKQELKFTKYNKN